MLMFVGGGSASTAGGIKVTTLAVLFLAGCGRRRRASRRWRRSVAASPATCCGSAVSRGAAWGATIVALSTIAILQITKAPLDDVLFDVISAFGTCGLSTGLTAELPDSGAVRPGGTMFMGRVGTVTLAAALAASSTRRSCSRRPEERPIVG